MGALPAAGCAGSASGRHTRDWLGVVIARQADLSDRLGATGRCASTAVRSSSFNLQRYHVDERRLANN